MSAGRQRGADIALRLLISAIQSAMHSQTVLAKIVTTAGTVLALAHQSDGPPSSAHATRRIW
jgi:hypothetical protein